MSLAKAILRTLAGIAACMLILSQGASAAELALPLPKFSDYPVEIYRGRVAKPIPGNAIHRAHPEVYGWGWDVKNKPIVAGHYLLVILPCGSACQMPDLIDARTGRSLGLPSVSSWREFYDGFEPILTRPDSRLVVLQGKLAEEDPIGVHYFVVERGRLKHLRTIKTDGNFLEKPDL